MLKGFWGMGNQNFQDFQHSLRPATADFFMWKSLSRFWGKHSYDYGGVSLKNLG